MTDKIDLEDAWVDGAHDREVVGANIARRRRELSMSQTELAKAMQVAGMTHWRQNTVSRIETGKQEISVREAEALRGIVGDVLAGTDFASTVRQAAGEFRNKLLDRKLRAVEASLNAALEDVRWLRTVVRGKVEDDGEHHEET